MEIEDDSQGGPYNVTRFFWQFVEDVLIDPNYRTLPPYLTMEKIVQLRERIMIDFRIFDLHPKVLFEFETQYNGTYYSNYLIFDTVHDMIFMLRDLFVFIQDGRGQTLTVLIQHITEWIEMDSLESMLQSTSIS